MAQLNSAVLARLDELGLSNLELMLPVSLRLVVDDQSRLALQWMEQPKTLPLCIDLSSAAQLWRLQKGGGVGQPVAKALGLNKNRHLRILDATSGLLDDAWQMVGIGAEVMALERHPVVHALQCDAYYRLGLQDREETSWLQRLHLTLADGVLQPQLDFSPDVVYLDPMFPSRKKSAKVKLGMQIFHQLIGPDQDADGLLPWALTLARHRVVVKRPKGAAFLADRKPSFSQEGKTGRFDIYGIRAISEKNADS